MGRYAEYLRVVIVALRAILVALEAIVGMDDHPNSGGRSPYPTEIDYPSKVKH